ncbi:MAG: FkbM family methyltransferase [Gammaproteobacteria bacterium]|nr:FkbM family methyltransferase [Gammaproteobacteria bacterium]
MTGYTMGFNIRRVLNRIQNSKKNEKATVELNFLYELASHTGMKAEKVFEALPHTKSQYYQDVFVLATLDFKQNGYFVEFGAFNGVEFSNTHLLEKRFGWHGILSEPARSTHRKLIDSRNAHIDFDCVWHTSKEQVKFREFPRKAHRSGIPLGINCPVNHVSKSSIEYEVDTVSLNDLLERYYAPNEIDYISIDTEGTEFEIIRNFDFRKYRIAVITIEHNKNRDKIFKLLSSYGYKRVLESVSVVDDWYVLA